MPPSRRSIASQNLLSFYSSTEGADIKGRTLTEILQWNANRLESSHDYIQILFPLPEESGVNWYAPVVDREIFEAFRGDGGEELRGRLRRAFERMSWFYGFVVENGKDGEVEVIPGSNFASHSTNWNVRMDHNHLRITRIIRSMRVLGLEDEALAFYNALETTAPIYVSKRSREYWRRAAERSLNIRPDVEVRDEEDDGIGPIFLQEWVRRQNGAKSEEEEERKDGGVLDY